MKRNITFIGLLLFLFGALGRAEEAPIRLTVVPTKESFTPLEPVILVVEAKNVSGTRRSIDVGSPWIIQVSSKGGEKAEWTEYGRRRVGNWLQTGPVQRYDWSPLYIPPGEAYSARIQLNRWVDMSEHGTYSVRIGKKLDPIGDPPKAETVMSDEVVVINDRGITLTSYDISEEVRQRMGLDPEFGKRYPSTPEIFRQRGKRNPSKE
jgi:hypothetical protein